MYATLLSFYFVFSNICKEKSENNFFCPIFPEQISENSKQHKNKVSFLKLKLKTEMKIKFTFSQTKQALKFNVLLSFP